jgi:hypothetical protein
MSVSPSASAAPFSAAPSLTERLHAEAVALAGRYKALESDLLDVLIRVERHEVYLAKGYPSLFQYVVSELGLSENVAYNLITVARKAREVPSLKAELESGAITLSNARRIAPVLTPENQAQWIEKAKTLSNRRLEKEIAKVRPEVATPERARYVSENRMKLELGLSESEMLRLRTAQDLVAQSRGRPVTLEETLEALVGEFLKKRDPLERARRVVARKGTGPSAKCAEPSGKPSANPEEKREKQERPASHPNPEAPPHRAPIPARVRHAVHLRDGRRCVYRSTDGKRCGSSRFIDLHHRVPVAAGGKDEVDNLITLCRAHHRWEHRADSGGRGRTPESWPRP